MEKQHMIQTDRRDIYKYGINQMLNMQLNIVTFFVIGLIFHMMTETVIFTLAYIPFRIYAGGFHAKTPFKCWIISAVMLLSALLFLKYINISIYFCSILAVIAAVLIFGFSPVEDENKPLDEKEKSVYKHRCILVFAAELLIVIALTFFRYDNASMCIEASWITLSVMLIIGKIKNCIIAKKQTNN